MKIVSIGLLLLLTTTQSFAKDTLNDFDTAETIVKKSNISQANRTDILNKVRLARHAFHQAKKEHGTEIDTFQMHVARLRQDLSTNIELSEKLKHTLEIGKGTDQILKEYFPTRSEKDILFSCTAEGSEDSPADFHIFLAGKRWCEEGYEVVTVGPGLWIGSPVSVFICALPQQDLGVNVGVSAKAGALLGLSMATFFGENGMCIELGIGSGLGAAVGVSVIYPEK